MKSLDGGQAQLDSLSTLSTVDRRLSRWSLMQPRLTDSGDGPMVGDKSQAPDSHSVGPKRAMDRNLDHGSNALLSA